MARHPADGSENDNVNANASGLLAEVAALRRQLAALEERLRENPPKESPGRQAKPRTARRTVAWLTTGAVLAMLAGVSVVYGQSAVDAFFISKEGDVAIPGNVAIGPSPSVRPSLGFKLLVSTPEPETSTNESAGLAVTTNAADNPFGLGIRLRGAPARPDRSVVLQSEGADHLLLQPRGNNVGIGTYTPNADNKLEVNGTIAAESLNVAVDQSVKIEGSGGRNLFSDSEKAGNLRVGGAWGTPGIYSEKGDVVVGSLSNNVWLYGKVAISKQGEAAKRNQPETLYVDGGFKATGTVDGDMKVIYQRDDDPTTSYSKPLWRYHLSLTAAKYGGRTKTIPKEILTKLCGTRDGCEVRLGMTRWDNDSKTQTASASYRFYYNPNDGHWRTSQGVNNGDGPEGVIGDGSTQHAVNIWNTCYFTDGTYDKYQNQGDKNTGMQLLVYNGSNTWNFVASARRTCELTLIP